MGNNETGNPRDPENPENGKKPAFHVSKQPVVHGKPVEDVHKFEATLSEPPQDVSEPPAYEDLGSLPASYGSKSVFLIARDPHWLFSYWDIDWGGYPPSRMQGGKVILKVFNADGGEVYSADINPDARNWYVPVSHGNATFYAEIGFFNEYQAWEVIARSNDATTPSDAISEIVSDSFATVPYHIAFQKVLDLVRSSMAEGESLLDALTRIQNEGRKLMLILGATPQWSDEQRRVLAALLGNQSEDILGLSSVELDILLRRQLKERLFSEVGSGAMGQFGGGESHLFSGAAFGSWTEVASWTQAGQSSLMLSWLSSWAGGQEVLSSWLASWGGAVETAFWSSFLSSWSGARERAALSSWLASWVGAKEVSALSSWLASWSGVQEVGFWSSYLSSWGGVSETVALSSWLASWAGGQETLSSWLSSWGEVRQAAFWSSFVSSWPTAAGASEVSSFWSSWLASWPTGVGAQEQAFWSSWLSSWAGGVGPSSAFGSREFGASWSAQPFGAPREFFMHVNAEVIFYGGTHPAAKVWVDGKPITLNPDGTFRSLRNRRTGWRADAPRCVSNATRRCGAMSPQPASRST